MSTSASTSGMDERTLAAVVAAVEASWPRAVVLAAEDVDEAPRWRFSGRWWSRPIASRRIRPW